MENDKSKKNKGCCYLFGIVDLVCFVLGSYLLSLAIFSNCTAAACSACCGCLGFLGLPLIALGFVIRSWSCICCYGKGGSTCSNNSESES